MADPSKKRVVCPVEDCEDKYVAETNKKSHYTNVHFSKDPSLPSYRPSFFKEMSADDHVEYTQRTGIVLHTSPYFQRPPVTSVFDLMAEFRVSNEVAMVLMLEALLKKRVCDLREMFADYARRHAAPESVAPADEEENEEPDAAPSPKKPLTAKQKAVLRKAKAALTRATKKNQQ